MAEEPKKMNHYLLPKLINKVGKWENLIKIFNLYMENLRQEK
jgi:hypothetical protein